LLALLLNVRIEPQSTLAEFAEDLFIVLAERGRWRINPRTAVGKGKRRQRYAESTLDPGGGLVAVNDAAARELWIGDGFRHRKKRPQRGRLAARGSFIWIFSSLTLAFPK
jgi:hypothetical protein